MIPIFIDRYHHLLHQALHLNPYNKYKRRYCENVILHKLFFINLLTNYYYASDSLLSAMIQNFIIDSITTVTKIQSCAKIKLYPCILLLLFLVQHLTITFTIIGQYVLQ